MADDAERWALHGATRAGAAIIVHAPDTSVLWANETAAELLGLTVDQMTGMHAADPSLRLLDADGTPLPLERYPIVEALRDEVAVAERVVGAVRNDRPLFWGRLSIEPVREDGVVVAVVVTFVDDTELIEARRALAESEARFARAVAGTQDGLWEVDLTTGATWYAPRFEQILGLSPGTLGSPESWREVVHPSDQHMVLAAWEGHVLGTSPYDVRYRMRHADGTWRHVRSRGQAERMPDGTPVRLSGAISDITEQVRAEEARTAMQAHIEAAARVESLAVLAGGVAHDFNNLLTGILGAADTARMVPDDAAEVEECLDLVVTSADQAAALTRQLMAYAGGTPLAVATVDPSRLVSDLVRLVRGTLPSEAALSVDLTDDTPTVRADPTQLHQVVMNLLVNAAEAIEPGGSVEVRTRRVERDEASLVGAHTCYGDPGLYAVIQVVDDGPGMAPTTLQRIFEPFYTTKPFGHGLGLAAVHGMIRSHHGYVDVQSRPGEGTRFEVGLPAVKAVAPTEEVPMPTHARLGRGRTALLVDDESAVRTVLRRMLELDGFVVYDLPDGDELEERVALVDPDIIVLDVLLPGRSGLELLAALRASGDHRPVLLSSGHAKAEQRMPELDGAVRFLPKPYRVRTLREKLAALLAAAPPA